jgi:hypothetical protein
MVKCFGIDDVFIRFRVFLKGFQMPNNGKKVVITLTTNPMLLGSNMAWANTTEGKVAILFDPSQDCGDTPKGFRRVATTHGNKILGMPDGTQLTYGGNVYAPRA